ncbi:MAG: D-alanyl-D-alanine carboxypeptidase [Phycisphaerae bacterium]|nr:D-alanyl-D-alanine carboxypeptidase [Phycisphaerae bacterium]
MDATRGAVRRAGSGGAAVCVLAIVLHAVAGAAIAQQRVNGTTVARLEEWTRAVPASWKCGVCVIDATDGRVLFEHDADRALKPASTLKLFTTAAALDRLGEAFSFRTEVLLHEDELWVIGGGDPGLGDERLCERRGERQDAVFERWAEQLARLGCRSVRRIVLDDRIFDQQERHPDWPADQSQAWYQAPVGGLNFNDNCLDVRVTVGANGVTIAAIPELPGDLLANRLTRGRHRPVLRRAADADVFELSGGVSRATTLGPVSALRPALFFGYALRQALLRRGIECSEVVRRVLSAEQRGGARRIAVEQTSIGEVVWRANTFSQNLFAEALIKALSAFGPDGRPTGQPGSWREGAAAVREIVERLGVSMAGAVVRDGSGLSHENRVSARQLAQLLHVMTRHRHAGTFASSLAAPGEPGTVRRRRLGSAPAEVRLRVKTGSIRGVSSLCGYVERPNGPVLAFAVICNECDDRAKQLEARLVEALSAE